MDKKEKKVRASATNFIPTDEELLVQLVISVKDVLISKKSDQFTNVQKNEQWKKLAVTYNASAFAVSIVLCCVVLILPFISFVFSFQPRDWQQIRDKFYKIKKLLRSEAAEVKAEIFQTGGGRKQKKKTPLVERHPIFQELSALMHTSIHGLNAMPGDDDFEGEQQEETSNQAAEHQQLSNVCESPDLFGFEECDDVQIVYLDDIPQSGEITADDAGAPTTSADAAAVSELKMEEPSKPVKTELSVFCASPSLLARPSATLVRNPLALRKSAPKPLQIQKHKSTIQIDDDLKGVPIDC